VAYPRRVAPEETPRAARPTDTRFDERLTVPWWSWPIALGAAAFLAAEVFLGRSTPFAWVPYAILVPGAAAGLLALGRVRVRVADGELWIDDAHIPVTYVTEVNVLDATGKAAVLGPLAAAHAFVVQRPWIARSVRVVIDDPADPTPYWLVSTRHPEKLAQAVLASRPR
jgi:hypothetical protein